MQAGLYFNGILKHTQFCVKYDLGKHLLLNTETKMIFIFYESCWDG
jgi:hypothetical protein